MHKESDLLFFLDVRLNSVCLCLGLAIKEDLFHMEDIYIDTNKYHGGRRKEGGGRREDNDICTSIRTLLVNCVKYSGFFNDLLTDSKSI